MTYVKQTWANGAGGGTPLSAARLNYMEDGIEAADITFAVTNSGVTGDGITDDTVALQTAINASPPGSIVFFPRGVYLISAPLRLLPYRRYIGDGWAKADGALIRQAAGANITNAAGLTGMLVPEAWFTDSTVCDGQLSIENLAIDGNRAANPTSTACGVIIMNFWSRITGCLITGAPVDAIRLTDTTNNGTNVITNTASECDVLDCKLNDPGAAGIRQLSANSNSLMDGNCKDNRISYVGTDAVSFERAAGWTFDNNHTYGVPGSGIGLSGCYATRVINNYIEDFGGASDAGAYYAGIRVSLLDARGTIISGNQVFGSELGVTSVYHYISVNANTGQTDAHAIITDNTIDGPGTGSGIGVVVQHSAGGVAHVERLSNRISNVTTPYYTAGGDIVYQGSQDLLPAARIYKNNTTNLTDSTLTTVNFQVVQYNRNSAYLDTSVPDQITVLVSGMYVVNVDLNLVGGTAGYRGGALAVNAALTREVAVTGTDAQLVICSVLPLIAGDVLTMTTYTTGGAPTPDLAGTASKDVGLAVAWIGF